MYCNKLQSLEFKNNKLSQDPYHIVNNYEPCNFSDLEKRKLSFRGLDYPLPPTKFDYGDYSTSFKLLCNCMLIL